ncbi:MAG: glycyl-radical enzyme activating protein [Bacteroidales bacterium]|nr:glycyl-radical enzyme activating protein [Bacteroidales bacterium]
MVIFDIKRYAINDGPGIRTTIFFKGCPLRCVWCHNPESWHAQPEWLFKQKKCIGCNCCGVHPHQLEWIKGDIKEGKGEACPTLALECCGREWSVDELMEEIEKERTVMTDSGGGVTFSGGEPLVQHKALMEALQACRQRGLHCCVDTTLYASPEVVRAVAAETDLFLVDLKVMDTDKHKHYTGVDNARILENIRLLASLGAPILFRLPLIEGINADEENIEATARFLTDLRPLFPDSSAQLRGISLLPYHEMGRDKHARRGTIYNPENIPMSTPSDATLERCQKQFACYGIEAKIGG